MADKTLTKDPVSSMELFLQKGAGMGKVQGGAGFYWNRRDVDLGLAFLQTWLNNAKSLDLSFKREKKCVNGELLGMYSTPGLYPQPSF